MTTGGSRDRDDGLLRVGLLARVGGQAAEEGSRRQRTGRADGAVC